MIGINRSLIKQFRAVFRRSVLQHTHRGGLQPAVEFVARPNELTIRSQLVGRAVSCVVVDAYEAETLRVPANALEDFEGRGQARVTLESIGTNQVLARWEDAGVPREKVYDSPNVDKTPEFAKSANKFTNNDPSLLKALHEAMESTASDHVQFATHNIQLRGTGEIVGTDGRQLLLQTGFQFPWKGDVLLPRVTVFGQDLDADGAVGIARIDDQICFRISPWTIWLPIDKEGRFPKYENVLPKVSVATSHLQLTTEDAAFLSKTLSHLPGQEEQPPTATLDLNGQVIVRARSAEQNRAAEVSLTRSTATGKAIRLALMRRHLARALQLGFTDLHIINAETPAMWTAEGRSYVFMNLGPSALVAPGKNDIQLRSDAEQSSQQPLPKREKPVKQRNQAPETIPHGNGQHAGDGNGRYQTTPQPETTTDQEPKSGGFDALLQEAEALKELLRDGYTRAHSLIAAAKQYRKQARVVNSTLASLRQLQEIAA